jgi:hypothetical protein
MRLADAKAGVVTAAESLDCIFGLLDPAIASTRPDRTARRAFRLRPSRPLLQIAAQTIRPLLFLCGSALVFAASRFNSFLGLPNFGRLPLAPPRRASLSTIRQFAN